MGGFRKKEELSFGGTGGGQESDSSRGLGIMLLLNPIKHYKENNYGNSRGRATLVVESDKS